MHLDQSHSIAICIGCFKIDGDVTYHRGIQGSEAIELRVVVQYYVYFLNFHEYNIS